MTSIKPKTKSIRSYHLNDVVVFHRTKDSFGGLSNMASGYPIIINGFKIPSTEALYQACRFPHLPELQREIISQRSPIFAKRISKMQNDESRADWYQIRVPIMRWCLRAKLAQNYHLFSQLLLSTGDRAIVELSKKDDFWGATPSSIDQNQLIGENVLGRLLMELREQLKNEHYQPLQDLAPLKIEQFSLFGEPISVVKVNDREEKQAGWQNNLF